MSDSTQSTPRQLSYLKALAEQTGASFVYPRTRADASREIDRLRSLKRCSSPPALVREAGDLSLAYATGVQPAEVAGYGIQASWYREPQDTSPTEKQLVLISRLAGELGLATEEPDTRLEASEEIERLTDLKRRRGRPGPERVTPSMTGSCATPSAPTTAISQAGRERQENSSAASKGAGVDESPADTALGRYRARADGSLRELVALPGAGHSTLLVDRVAGSGEDTRLVAHIAPDEPPENPRILSSVYLSDATRGRCRLVVPPDFRGSPPTAPRLDLDELETQDLRDPTGRSYELRELSDALTFPELRWACSADSGAADVRWEVLTLREVVGRLEAYEPARSMTSHALELRRGDRAISTVALGAELAGLLASPLLLNRRLREALKDEERSASFSEIAARCGRLKRDRKGRASGDTSWLARRIGQMPDASGHTAVWIHTDTLALIAREGLCRPPLEVEAS
jgi:hypothetical protein